MLRSIASFVQILSLAVAVALEADAQAFGFTMGAPASTLRDAELVEDGGPLLTYRTKNAPTPHSEMESYLVIVSKKLGICKVAGISKDYLNDADGTDVRFAFKKIADSLSDKYVGGRTFDFLHAGSIWNEPQDFAMSLRKDQRTLVFAMDSNNSTGLPDDIENIMVESAATSSDDTYLLVKYEFSNFSDCIAEKSSKDESGL